MSRSMQISRVLLVEDDDAYAAVVGTELESSPLELQRVATLHAARAILARESFDAILLDLSLPDSTGMATVEAVQALVPDTPVVILTGTADEELSVTAVQLGAQDYLLKHEVDGTALVRAVRYAIERAALRRGLRDSEARFRAMVENGHDAITLVGADGRIQYDSRSVTHVLGYTPEERVGRLAGSEVHPEDVERIREKLAYCLTHPDEVINVDYRFRHKDGSWRYGEATGVNRLTDPAIKAIVVNHRDVTERRVMESALKRSELQLRQAQKMEAVGRLAGGVAHDFNNVLTAIFGYADLLLDQFAADDPRRADVVEIRHSADRAAALTRQLLAFSRKQVVQPRTLDLNQTVKSVEKLLGRLVSDDVHVEIDLAPGLGEVLADPGSIEQVLMNLAANARDAMPEGGRFRVATRNERIDPGQTDRPGLAPGDYVVLEVSDTGVGISTAVREHIFEPFFTTKEPGKGTGLGLATVYGVVKQSGGTVYVDSEEGQGTTFLIYLPRLGVAAAVPRQP
jgi:two-component system cell cycle sensor histidine kinase/response regulator CckA